MTLQRVQAIKIMQKFNLRDLGNGCVVATHPSGKLELSITENRAGKLSVGFACTKDVRPLLKRVLDAFQTS